MKKVIIYEILKAIRSKPARARKLKVFAVGGLVIFLLLGGLAIWVGISATKYVASSVNQVITSPASLNTIQGVQDQIQNLRFNPADCWGKFQSLMSVQPWVENSAQDNLKTLKIACVEKAAFP